MHLLHVSAIDPPEPETVVMVEGLASSRITEADFVRWVRKHSR